ncbi:hypothetical protein FACS1894139_12060 [Planctomycetales bacterium]|nr:hypothetical protein FACS1894107_08880 [Planctomycetales bacterium]GHT06376.1 hypothetical protein FACS1894139_12060 [Planctomycetales bacterium]
MVKKDKNAPVPTPTPVEVAALKKNGFMPQKQPNLFSMRLKVTGGQVTAAQLRHIAAIAEKYGRGYAHFTSRQSVEIPFVALADIDALKQDLAGVIEISSGGARVRTITACQGAAICASGKIDTTALADELDRRYFGRALPHKFKIGVTGCKNNCLKAEENDLGIKGGVLPKWQKKKCNFCGACVKICPAKTLTLTDKKITVGDACRYCGQCVKICPQKAWSGKNGYVLSFGGMFGNQIQPGARLLPFLLDRADVFRAADAVLAFFAANGKAGERLGKLLTRIGAEKLRAALEAAIER